MVTSTVNIRTGQIVCYKTGQVACSLHWGYGAVAVDSKRGLLLLHNAPSLTIEAKWNTPVRVKWINDLKDPLSGNYLPHLLAVDPTLHWANPPGGLEGRDMQIGRAHV